MTSPVIKEVVEHLEALPLDVQKQVLALVRNLDATGSQGVAGEQLLQFAGTIPQSELELMQQAIDKDCEQVNTDDW